MAYALEELSENNAAEWDAFLCNQPYHNPLQSGKLFLCLKDQYNYHPGGVIARDTRKPYKSRDIGIRYRHRQSAQAVH